MKVKVEYSESIQIHEGLWRKIGVEIEDDKEERMPDTLYEQAKNAVKRWHSEEMPDTDPHMYSPAAEPKTITVDRPLHNTIEALKTDIQSCNDITTIDSYRLLVKKHPELEEVYAKRRSELTS